MRLGCKALCNLLYMTRALGCVGRRADFRKGLYSRGTSRHTGEAARHPHRSCFRQGMRESELGREQIPRRSFSSETQILIMFVAGGISVNGRYALSRNGSGQSSAPDVSLWIDGHEATQYHTAILLTRIAEANPRKA